MRKSPKSWGCLGVVIICVADIPAESATNAWTKRSNGSWEEPHWSLGALPAADQFICFTNEGFKALAIGTNTIAAYPQTLAVNALVVSAPAGSSNLLMLNYAGYGRPLNVAETLVIGRNAGLFSLSSALRVGDLTRGSFLINGVVSQGAHSDVAARLVWVGHEAAGTYQLSNGWFSADSLLIGGTNYTSNWSTFIQDDGSHAVNQLSLRPRSTFKLKGGTVDALELVVGEGFPRIPGGRLFSIEPQFVQANGAVTVSGDLLLAGGEMEAAPTNSMTARSLRIQSGLAPTATQRVCFIKVAVRWRRASFPSAKRLIIRWLCPNPTPTRTTFFRMERSEHSGRLWALDGQVCFGRRAAVISSRGSCEWLPGQIDLTTR
jgi:hypothetical protein